MRMHLGCMVCLKEDGTLGDARFMSELKDDWTFEVRCDRGHVSRTLLQEQRFEYLAELAVNGIVDGYYRESIASFAAALERFYEFYVRVILLKNSVSDETYRAMWKTISKQSERQLGAYTVLYTLENRAQAPTLLQKFVEARNDVIHRGKVPSRDEAISFGDAVLAIIRPTLSKLRDLEQRAIQAAVSAHLSDINRSLPPNAIVSTMSYPTIVSLNREDEEPPSDVRAWTEKLVKRRAESGW